MQSKFAALAQVNMRSLCMPHELLPPAETITELLKEQQEIMAEQRPDKPPAAR